jgi:5-formyltetrahydrofolate cyclo-ligase
VNTYINTDKQQLREVLLAKRLAMDTSRRNLADASILSKLLQSSDYKEAATIFTYVSVDAEVSTKELIDTALSCGKRVCVPRCIEGNRMIATQINNWQDLRTGKHGLLEPKPGLVVIPVTDIDLIIVPCLAATKDGFRLGYGGGYYDRYLANARKSSSSAKSVALCRFEFLYDSLPTDEYDIAVDRVICDLDIAG